MSELGVVGLVLLLTALGTILVGGVLRLGGPSATPTARSSRRGTMLAIHAGIDWDWEMPALFVWLFGAGGVALGGAQAQARRDGRGRRVVVAALAVLVLAMTPALFAYSQGPLDRAVSAFAVRNCDAAIDAALTATERFGTRPEPWQVLGYCDARLGQYALARRAMDAARSRDPNNWQYAYGQAIVYGVSGLDRGRSPRGAAAEPARPGRLGAGQEPGRGKDPARRRDVTVRAPYFLFE